ncbi:MAG: hypothetical protein ACRDOH_34330 [Streptosporangiaceae bacterium]
MACALADGEAVGSTGDGGAERPVVGPVMRTVALGTGALIAAAL